MKLSLCAKSLIWRTYAHIFYNLAYMFLFWVAISWRRWEGHNLFRVTFIWTWTWLIFLWRVHVQQNCSMSNFWLWECKSCAKNWVQYTSPSSWVLCSLSRSSGGWAIKRKVFSREVQSQDFLFCKMVYIVAMSTSTHNFWSKYFRCRVNVWVVQGFHGSLVAELEL